MKQASTKRKPRRTARDWKGVPAENAVARLMSRARFKLGDLGHDGGVGLRALYISGPPGVGKTHHIVEQEKRWETRGIRAMRFRPRNVHELLDAFQQSNGRRPLIMEEADVIFRSKPMFEILKQATDPLTPDIFYRVQKVEGEKVAVPINLNVPIIVSTNMDLLGEISWDKNLLPDRDALFNRSMPIVIPEEPYALWEWSIYLALRSDLTLWFDLRNPAGGKPLKQSNALSIQATALDWFSEQLPNLMVVSPRTLKQVAQIMGRAHRGDMPKEIADEELQGLLGATRDVEVPFKADWSKLLQEMPK